MGVHIANRVDLFPLTGDGVAAPVVAEDHAAGRQVGAQQVLAQLIGAQFRIIDECLGGAHHFTEVVWWDVGGHTHRDAR